MPTATLTAPTGEQTGNFGVSVVFGDAILSASFEKTDINVTGDTTGVDYEVMGVDGTDFQIPFTLPFGASGSITIEITGMVTVQSNNMNEAVMGNTVTIMYNVPDADVSGGTVDYRDDGVIGIPITLSDPAIAPNRTAFALFEATGYALADVDFYFQGQNTDYELIIVNPPDRKGSFRVELAGQVFNQTTGVWQLPTFQPLTIDYDTTVPLIDNYDIPANYEPDQRFDIRFSFNVPITGLDSSDIPNAFVLEGANLGSPTLYRWTDTTPPDFTTAQPDSLTNWDEVSPDEEGQYFLMRFDSVLSNASGIFNLSLKEGVVRGPVN